VDKTYWPDFGKVTTTGLSTVFHNSLTIKGSYWLYVSGLFPPSWIKKRRDK